AWQDQGLCALTDTAEVDSVADIHPSEAAHPSPAARCNHHEAAEAASPVAVAVIATTHSTTTLDRRRRKLRSGRAPRRRWRRRWRERNLTCGSWVSPRFDRMRYHIRLFRRANDPSGSTARLKSTI